MHVIGVVDLRAGQAVRARGGHRDAYQPVMQVAGSAIPPGDPAALARTYVDEYGVSAIYAADLDAIRGLRLQDEQLSTLAAVGVPLWVDAGIHSTAAARQSLGLGTSRVVIGLETLRSFGDLEAICTEVDPERVAFSLDLRGGTPIMNSVELAEPAQDIARRATDAGVRALIVLDLERVGMRLGLDLQMLKRVRDAVPETLLVAGGGVRGLDDLTALARLWL